MPFDESAVRIVEPFDFGVEGNSQRKLGTVPRRSLRDSLIVILSLCTVTITLPHKMSLCVKVRSHSHSAAVYTFAVTLSLRTQSHGGLTIVTWTIIAF